MIPVIIHNFFPLAAELLAGSPLHGCLFDARCITLCSPPSPSHTTSHIIPPLLSFTLHCFLFLFSFIFRFWIWLSVFLPFCSPLSNNGQLTIEWSGAHTIKWHPLCALLAALALWQFTVSEKQQVKDESPYVYFSRLSHKNDTENKPASITFSHMDIKTYSYVEGKSFVRFFQWYLHICKRTIKILFK